MNEKRRLRKIQLNTILKSYEVVNYDNDNNNDYDVYDTYVQYIEKEIKLNISPDLEMKLRLYLTKTKENK